METILVVDDEEALRNLVVLMLESEGYKVLSTADGESALAFIRAEPIDLVLLDLRMPGMDGWAVIDRLRSVPDPPRVVAMSGMAVEEPPELQQVRECVFGYLSKPFSREQLLKTCLAALAAPARSSVDANRRRETRRNLVVPAVLLTQDGTPAALGQILNISSGGVLIDLGIPLQPGAEVNVSFEIPGGRGPFQVRGRIRWRDECKLGVAFEDLPQADRERLQTILSPA
jgi:CheY-like chemotaxis protein